MKIRLTVVIDGTDEQCEQVLDQLEEIRDDEQLLRIGPDAWAQLLKVKEVEA